VSRRFLSIALIIGTAVVFVNWPVQAEETTPAGDRLPASARQTVNFAKDVQPILKRACLRCHGDEKQKGDYRLDVRDVALNGGESYAPNIVPQKSDDSPLIKFVTGTGDLVMPPEGERLTPDEINTLRAWIDQGATWPDELAGTVRDKRELWSLKPLVKPVPPTLKDQRTPLASIDAFVRAKLAEQQFAWSKSADRRTMIRRVYFDLTGLPPTPTEVDSFVADPDRLAYEKLLDKLLESPRYGERWARHWLDAAHFAETHGNDQDRIRENAWPYRDYLIQALNADKPYERFIQEQIAGDVLFPDDPTATAALGFLAAGPWDESSLRDIREDTLDRQIARYLDRDDMLATVMNNVNSLTVQCARCHDHKFDPISQRDYYALQAVFSGVERANRRYDADPAIGHQRRQLTQRKHDLESRSPAVMDSLLSDEVQQQVARWEQGRGASGTEWYVMDAASFTSSDGATLTRLPDCSILSGGSRPDKDTVTMVSIPLASCVVESDLGGRTPSTDGTSEPKPRTLGDRRITAVRLEILTDDSLPRRGPGRQDNGNMHLSEFEVFVDANDKPEALVNPTSDYNQPDWEIAKAIDQKEPTAWGIDPQEGKPHRAVFELKEPLWAGGEAGSTEPVTAPAVRRATHLKVVLKQWHGRQHLIGRMRISLTDAATPVRVDALPDPINAILTVPLAERTRQQRQELALYVQLEAINRDLSLLPKPNFVYAAAADFEPDGSMKPPPGPRPIHILHRGDIRNPRQEVTPGAIACITALPSQFDVAAGSPESARRAALAKWLTSRDNPLTWRSIVNRVWHHHFGRGLVGTLNDFGHMGETPTHPELLDWLAVEFRDNGQSLKSLHRLIMTSQTYRQSVEAPTQQADAANGPENIDPRLALDADNRLLWRMNRTRLDAESVRDAVLAISGRLDLRMGGPSDRQFDLQPGIHVTPRVDYGKFDVASDLGRRRSIYRFLFRTLPDPFMESLDCPSGDQITPARGNSVTVQQALALWNDVFIARHCEFIAERVEQDVANQKATADSPDQQIHRKIQELVRLILGRAPTLPEKNQMSAYAARHGLANLCRLLLNSNEFLFLN